MTDKPDRLLHAVRRRRERHRFWQRSGEPSVAGYLAQIGVLGWTIVLPTLGGIFLGRWVDRKLGMGMVWTGALLMVGLGLGSWAAWRWMHRQ
jgi:ATP synthase protein I